ncbi:MAG: flavin reductase family protein [Dehalococcoidales bacterium]|nr:flavin reductase family protein [Dehalococcoidales bacterium]
MAKVKINPQPLICTTPTVLVGAMVEGKPNFMAVAWCGVANSVPPMVSVAIRPVRHTLKGIRATGEFSVNVPSVGLVKEADYCGMVSGAKADKASVCKFEVFYGDLQNAPLINQCPVNLSCKVVHILELESHLLIIGEVEETYVTKTCLTDDKPDIRKIKPLIYAATMPTEYFAFGESVGKAYSVGKELIEEK